jgi:type II secretory pathway pseudopilin PulG
MRCFHRKSRIVSQPTGFTLLEVIVGLVLMATVLVGSLLSFAAHQRQRRFADTKLSAIATADELLDRLSGSPQGIPQQSQGLVPNRPNWLWRTYTVGALSPAQIPLRVIRFEILEVTGQPIASSTRPLVTIDVVKPLGAE